MTALTLCKSGTERDTYDNNTKAIMNDWHAFLTQQGAQWSGESLVDFDNKGPHASPAMIPMTGHQLLQVEGADAAKFLQGQCTCDIDGLKHNRVLLGGHCNRQGRMISSFTLANLPAQTIGLRLRRNVAANTLATMSRYIVFSKATLTESEYVGLALLGAQAADLPFAEIPEPGDSGLIDGGALLHHTSGLFELWLTPARARELWISLAAHFKPATPSKLDGYWVEQGIAEVQAATQEDYIPQQLNYHSVGAISFKKGCYTGQEIVARMQYRGQLKKHCYRLVSDDEHAQAAVGAALIAAGGETKTIATVVATAPGQVLAVANDDAVEAGEPLLEPATGTKFTWADLPYAIP